MTAPNPLQQLGIPARDADLATLDARDWEPIAWGKQRGFRFTIDYAATPSHVDLFSLGTWWVLGIHFGAIAGPRVSVPIGEDRGSAEDVAFTLHELAAGSREHAAVVG
jgi:hypothetical protein